LWRFDQGFIGGSVSALLEGVEECVEGASVELLRAGEPARHCTTDAFGDFRFDRLAPNSGSYTVRIALGDRRLEAVVQLQAESIYLGKLELT
jgi:hypothetical protein